MATIEIDHITKVYGNGFVAVQDVSLAIRDGEFIVLVGPSGCGKSTLLRMIAGLEDVSAGSVLIGDRDVTDLAPRHRDIAMVFQSYALYPHLTVRQNLGYGLKVRKTPKDEIARRVDAVARTLGLVGAPRPASGSALGGQRQRVAMGRAIVREPRAFLMDEPLSNLDAKLRVGMRASLAQLHAKLGITTVYVTHDQTEAMTLGTRVAVMRDGKLIQVATPQGLYTTPVDVFVAAFIGSPAMNLVEAAVSGDRAPLRRARAHARRAAPARRRGRSRDRRHPAGGVRGRVLCSTRAPAPHRRGRGRRGARAGHARLLPCRCPAPCADGAVAADDDTTLLARESMLFTARVDPRTRILAGSRAELTVDPRRLHFFDPATGRASRLRSSDATVAGLRS